MALIDLFSPTAAHTVPGRRPTLRQRLDVWRSRRALAKLDAAQLDDVGITAETARRESQKGVWDVPKSWTNR